MACASRLTIVHSRPAAVNRSRTGRQKAIRPGRQNPEPTRIDARCYNRFTARSDLVIHEPARFLARMGSSLVRHVLANNLGRL